MIEIDDVARAGDEIRLRGLEEGDRLETAFEIDDGAEVEVADVTDPHAVERRRPARRGDLDLAEDEVPRDVATRDATT